MIIKSFEENKVNLKNQKIHLLYGENQGQIQDFIDQIFKKKIRAIFCNMKRMKLLKMKQ